MEKPENFLLITRKVDKNQQRLFNNPYLNLKKNCREGDFYKFLLQFSDIS